MNNGLEKNQNISLIIFLYQIKLKFFGLERKSLFHM